MYYRSLGGAMVYDVTKYLDDHPGGAEVLLDVGGQDADEFFEDIGHSKEARAELKKFMIGKFKLDAAAKAKMEEAAAKRKAVKGSGFPLGAALAVVLAAGAYFYIQHMQQKQQE